MDDKLIESFHQLWNTFPLRVRLIDKKRTVLAVNKAAERDGMSPGDRCIDTLPKSSHMGCKADAALREKRAIYAPNPNGTLLRFWIPVEGQEDVYVHFSIPMSEICPSDSPAEDMPL